MTATAPDQLFLLKPFFTDPKAGDGLFHCPGSCRVEGLLSFYPFLRARMQVQYLEFPRPRTPIVDLLGAEHQSCPVLVLGEQAPDGPRVSRAPTGRRFVADSDAIAEYLAKTHGIPAPHP